VATATEMLVMEELAQLRENAALLGWTVTGLDGLDFILGVPAKDGSWLYVRCEPEAYPTRPPAWRWCDAEGGRADAPEVSAKGGQFFHSAGVICAPWNRLAYKTIDGRGPHGDWDIGAWMANEKTRQCRTLAAMAGRIAVEAARNFDKRMG